ncbi:MAG TPA: HU family DNA-binding protein [Verrucomicrobiota bacterium]|nr:DNA-binding protein [Verrucomicrobiales bacterium]HRI15666.1 HU family DNA-binding protein [Verrucomicrobiota bacterium]
MAKALTKSQIAAALAEGAEISKKQAVVVLETLAQLAYKNAKNTFTFPGIGKLVLVNRKAREGRNPQLMAQANQFPEGDPRRAELLKKAIVKIPAKKVVKFRVAKAAKDTILGAK